jgi:hypothetical protein
MNTNLKLYVLEDEYNFMAGPDWPTYTDYIAGVPAAKPEIREEIAQFTDTKISSGVIFPIRTQTSCQSKWAWSTIWLNQLSTSSCHRVNNVSFTLEEFDNFHNLPKKLNDRKLMLDGQWPRGGCEYCRDMEAVGAFSDRQHNIDIRGLTPPELLQDPTATVVSPTLVEIFAQNTCNFACVYCNANLSSKIEQENIKFGHFESNNVSIPIVQTPTVAAQEYFKKFISWLDKNIKNLRRLHLLGGETFLQHELMNNVLDVIERNPNSKLQFCMFSNLNVPDKYWNTYLARIKDLQHAEHIEVFDLTASIDCWGPESEYVRHGLDLNKFENRLAWAAQQGDWLRIHINQTITAMTMRTMADLIKKISQYSDQKHIGHYFSWFVGHDTYQHPKNWGWDMWEQDAKNIMSVMPTKTPAHHEAIDRMVGMLKYLEKTARYNYQEIDRFKVYFDEIDRRRGTNWRSLFAYLDVNEKT